MISSLSNTIRLIPHNEPNSSQADNKTLDIYVKPIFTDKARMLAP